MTDHSLPKLCPKNHAVGTAFGGGLRCSRISCGFDRAAARALLPPKPKPPVQQMPEEEQAIQKRFQLARMPMGLEGDAATSWAKQKLADMLPEAVAQLQWDLRKGTDKVRTEAARDVLKANGMDKREAASDTGRPTFIVNINSGTTSAPWLERLKKPESK